MLFRSFVQDAPECAVKVVDGKVQFESAIASPAMTCPDAFAWSQYLEAIQGEFWNWAIDQTVWPAVPWPICALGQSGDCCPRDILKQPGAEPNVNCPYNRQAFDPVPALPTSPNGTPSSVVLSHRGAHKKTDVEKLDPGRMLRDLEVELIFRNPPMVEYIFKNDMYSREGMAARVNAANQFIAAGNIGAAQALEVRLHSDATMVKADFLHQDIMLAQGLIEPAKRPGVVPNNPDYPYLTIYLEGEQVKLEDGSSYDTSGYYYMLAMTNASKAIPDWHWYAMEHVGNLGRCDFIGCNDSFGFRVYDQMANGARFGGSYIPPQQRLENNQALTEPNADPNNAIFLLGQSYDPQRYGEQITPALDDLFKGLGIATAAVDRDPAVITVTDPAWRNYRLKGTQTGFTTSHGVPTGTGATITEGGFVNSASCMTCHSQASMDSQGNPGVGGAVGASWRLNLFGFGQVEMGAPQLSWFFYPGTSSPYAAMQFDFIWGILNAQCVRPAASGNGCASIPAAPTLLD
ncbi:MAG: hypothetical protein KKC01_06005 [Gammaproteobacteria bacterium]|nr:hypothetical protein [Gammaproteobacteria bacterium]